ncbi:hypothetical protein E2320_001467 [Naja naja]|nr:hypothetical protein E2320_001467 [Naja naja]
MSSKAKNPTSDEGSSGEQRKAIDLNSKTKDLSAHNAGKKMDTIEGGGGGGLACSAIPAILKNKKRIRKENKRTSGMKAAARQQEGLTHTITPHTEMSSKPEDESSSKETRIDLSQTTMTVNAHKAEKKIIRTLELLPIPNKNMLEESKILPIIQRWARTKSAIPQLSEGDGYSSENTSRAHTPLNTPDPASAKPLLEGEMDTPKKLASRRLKIISENSMDSALSDTASEVELKESKEDLEPPDYLPAEAGDEQPLEQEAAKGGTTEVLMDTTKAPAAADQEAEPEAEGKESHTPKLEDPVAAETPSQDEEEGVSDVESERSQEPTDKLMDLSDLATKLLDGWKELKLLRQQGAR